MNIIKLPSVLPGNLDLAAINQSARPEGVRVKNAHQISNLWLPFTRGLNLLLNGTLLACPRLPAFFNCKNYHKYSMVENKKSDSRRNDPNYQQVNLSLKPDLVKKLKLVVLENDLNLSELAENAFDMYLESLKQKE